jgi:hypothetical protein
MLKCVEGVLPFLRSLCADVQVIAPCSSPSALIPTGGLRYHSFPALIVADTNGDSGSTSRVKRRMNTMKARRASVGKRRAVSELTVSFKQGHLCVLLF